MNQLANERQSLPHNSDYIKSLDGCSGFCPGLNAVFDRSSTTRSKKQTSELTASEFSSHLSSSHERVEIERYIGDVFYRYHRACLDYFLPELFELRSARGVLSAAIGVGCLQNRPVYLERYLSMPVEQAVSAALGFDVTRADIIEIGNLACSSAGASRLIIGELAHELHARKLRWAVFTGTSMVTAVLHKMGINSSCLALAHGECMGNELSNWGTYYTHNPRVLVVNVAQVVSACGTTKSAVRRCQ
ncbi:MAG: thermostable hemolysin [Pseudomonadales bacterium]